MKTPSTKPYLIRAIHEWCSDSGHTPYLSVKVDARTRVPLEFVRNGEIVLNISPEATHRLTLGNDLIQFSARFNGVSHEISIPVDAVLGIFPKETSQGILFPVTEESDTAQSGADAGNADGIQPSSSTVQTGGKPHLQVIK